MNKFHVQQSCVFDQCETDGNNNVFLQAVEDYAAQCQSRGRTVCNWREETGSS